MTDAEIERRAREAWTRIQHWTYHEAPEGPVDGKGETAIIADAIRKALDACAASVLT